MILFIGSHWSFTNPSFGLPLKRFKMVSPTLHRSRFFCCCQRCSVWVRGTNPTAPGLTHIFLEKTGVAGHLLCCKVLRNNLQMSWIRPQSCRFKCAYCSVVTLFIMGSRTCPSPCWVLPFVRRRLSVFIDSHCAVIRPVSKNESEYGGRSIRGTGMDASSPVPTQTLIRSRFASVTYGRPLGINDKDCNVSQPIDTSELRSFRVNTVPTPDASICYSTYQRELNKLYLIASPLIEVIFGMRAIRPSGQNVRPQYMDQIMEVAGRIWAWRQQLPPHLRLDLDSDCDSNQSLTANVHRLQALSLQLTFDSLLIIFYRPLLAEQVDHLIRNQSQPETAHGQANSPSGLSDPASSPFFTASATSPLARSQISSTEQWWDAALRTSKVTEMPQLAQLATDSHLVAFLAINLFNSAIVMAVLALSDPLSDRAQQVKRTITRIFRLQELLGKKTQLSVQSNTVLKDVIHMLLRREADAMLAPITGSDGLTDINHSASSSAQTAALMSVEETLRLPMQLPISVPNSHYARRQHNTADRAMRLNESLASVQQGKHFPIPATQSTVLSLKADWIVTCSFSCGVGWWLWPRYHKQPGLGPR